MAGHPRLKIRGNLIRKFNPTKRVWYDDVIKWKHFPRYWPFVQGIHRSRVVARGNISSFYLKLHWSPHFRMSKIIGSSLIIGRLFRTYRKTPWEITWSKNIEIYQFNLINSHATYTTLVILLENWTWILESGEKCHRSGTSLTCIWDSSNRAQGAVVAFISGDQSKIK